MKNIYLIGFMGAGKSAIGPLLAEKIGYKFVDADSIIEEEAEKSIPEIFKQKGQKHFRDLESKVIHKLARLERLVVALGGGAPIRYENRAIIKKGISIYLQVEPAVILERTSSSSDRPLLAGLKDQQRLGRIEKMLNEREKYYQEADIVVNNGKRPIEEVVEEINRKVKSYEKNKC